MTLYKIHTERHHVHNRPISTPTKLFLTCGELFCKNKTFLNAFIGSSRIACFLPLFKLYLLNEFYMSTIWWPGLMTVTTYIQYMSNLNGSNKSLGKVSPMPNYTRCFHYSTTIVKRDQRNVTIFSSSPFQKDFWNSFPMFWQLPLKEKSFSFSFMQSCAVIYSEL